MEPNEPWRSTTFGWWPDWIVRWTKGHDTRLPDARRHGVGDSGTAGCYDNGVPGAAHWLDKELASDKQLVPQARDDNGNLIDHRCLRSGIVGQLLETALEVEMTENLSEEATNAPTQRTPVTGPLPGRCGRMWVR